MNTNSLGLQDLTLEEAAVVGGRGGWLLDVATSWAGYLFNAAADAVATVLTK